MAARGVACSYGKLDAPKACTRFKERDGLLPQPRPLPNFSPSAIVDLFWHLRKGVVERPRKTGGLTSPGGPQPNSLLLVEDRGPAIIEGMLSRSGRCLLPKTVPLTKPPNTHELTSVSSPLADTPPV